MTTGMPSATHGANAHAWRWLPVLLLLLATGVFAIPATPMALPEIAPIVPAAAVQVQAIAAQRRCPGCGRVVSIRHVEATGTTPASFELMVRLRDGSLHTSRATDIGRWKAGDRIILLGGAL